MNQARLDVGPNRGRGVRAAGVVKDQFAGLGVYPTTAEHGGKGTGCSTGGRIESGVN